MTFPFSFFQFSHLKPDDSMDSKFSNFESHLVFSFTLHLIFLGNPPHILGKSRALWVGTLHQLLLCL